MVLPQILHPNVQVNDITRQFRGAASRLRPGKLVKDEHFTLFEAVSALEIGDPKMDSGALRSGPDDEEDLDLSLTPSAEEIIWLMDELTCREVAWHTGYPLSQTLFTSVHIERLLWPEPKHLTDARFDRGDSGMTQTSSLLLSVFQPYCLGLIKCCDLVLSTITSEHYYEEEDFATQVYNRPLLHNFPVDEVSTLLQGASIWLQDSNIPAELKQALKVRLDLRHSLLHLFESRVPGPRNTVEDFEKFIGNINTTEASTVLGQPTVDESFTLKIQRKLASSVPPRPMVTVERPRTFAFLRRLITDCRLAFQLFDISCSRDLLVAYQTFMGQSPQPAVYVRALVQSFLTCNDAVLGKSTVRDFISQDMGSLVRPAVLLADHIAGLDDQSTNTCSDLETHLDSFMNRCGHSFLNLFRTFCLNRCRVRRTLCHAVLEWDEIQAQAEDIDTLAQSMLQEEPASYPSGDELTFSYSLSSWVYHHKLTQLRTIVQMGFELAIYTPHEFADMYWYLTFVSSTHLSHLERVSFFVSSTQLSKLSPEQDTRYTLRRLYKEFTWLKAVEALSKALHRMIVVLQRHGQLATPKPAYASDFLRYELRMRPFMHLSVPEPISVEMAKQSSSLRNLPDQVLLHQASQLIQVARKALEEVMKDKWSLEARSSSGAHSMTAAHGTSAAASCTVESEWTKDVQDCMRTCIGAGIAISTLNKALQESRVTAIKVDIPPLGHRDRWHKSWPVPKIHT
ncbi:N-alpha-acetyltransferase, non-catalitic subunit [Exophiala dermatitidis]|uniref:Amino-acid N-acetyltransferase subunit Mak10 n=1 Tax=Exophiala dermatitidis (strain ATCC 34100 / CBS 525.76 / NIH/UT8656) TaxID=858893 RepID=H6BUA5_EXODN|nr:uncharacterized protein HMPREF1120_02998 [Exophiala dermatitidis NIH/UT8656]KAJ4502188.1 N-alpha-acetyltransferase, non-catalitic subunit [Exophiala dermatitidis]EHY54835.1 hypothetical protein HMPREF1120_02998 [Exophiala dermatitidis NIH/UT8656]KAJ4502507.1 N-alpha-acetyltransferase, non-catalitic subunit [Exophiala dermatitidis]KAJ4530325.1 N-alpha-acetyltransferase, non-catalitic subunit [Exophiala dermatitidis]KAJ4561250.1 N-alpha-acetyltransferase, non-catalitic subunit [Exophiala derm